MRDPDLRPLRQSTSAVLALCLSMFVAAPSLLATEGEAPESAESTAAQTAEPEKKDNGDEATEKQKKGPSFIPIPIIITEPAVGVWSRRRRRVLSQEQTPRRCGWGEDLPVLTAETAAEAGKQQKVPPTISGIAAAYTESGTWALGFAHSASWKRDRMRYVGAIGYAHVVTTFYFNDEPYEFTLDTGLLYQDFKSGSSRVISGSAASWSISHPIWSSTRSSRTSRRWRTGRSSTTSVWPCRESTTAATTR